jgi:hypothetical protein
MPRDLFSILTLLTSFLCMAISLWFAIYLLSRSYANNLTFRAIIALVALAFYFNNSFSSQINPVTDSGLMRSLATTIALLACQDLTYYLLNHERRVKLRWLARGILLAGIVMIIFQFSVPTPKPCDPRYSCATTLTFPYLLIDLFKVLVFLVILYYIWLTGKGAGKLRSLTFYLAVLAGVSTIGYGLVASSLRIDLPRLLPNLFILVALILLIFSVAQGQTLVARRFSPYDLPVTMLTIAAIVGVYVLVTWQLHLPSESILLLAVMAIFTHSAYDFVREFLNRIFIREEHRQLEELRTLGRDISIGTSFNHFLQRGLAILCHNLHAQSGFIALCQVDGQYEIVVSKRSFPVGTIFHAWELTLDANSVMQNSIRGQIVWVASAYEGNKSIAAIGLEQRSDQIPFDESDLFWLEDIAQEIGWMLHAHYHKEQSDSLEKNGELIEKHLATVPSPYHEGVSATFAYKLDPEMVRCIEEAFRHLHDYSELGKSPLVALFNIHAEDHIERGKLVQQKLMQLLEKFRPAGEPPSEPLPSEWYAYTILHDAYVEDKLSREIMAKLYISEGTYYRMRRQAMRGITRALLETGAYA